MRLVLDASAQLGLKVTGIRFLPRRRDGRKQRSDAEAAVVKDLVDRSAGYANMPMA